MFSIGQKVFDLTEGVGTVRKEHGLKLVVAFRSGETGLYELDGREYSSDKNPLLWSLADATARGYDVSEPPQVEFSATVSKEKEKDGVVTEMTLDISPPIPGTFVGKSGTFVFTE